MEASSNLEDCSGDLLKRRSLQRVGSGASDVIDPAEVGAEAEAESGRKLPSSRFKGVVPQPNGRWGSQIYEKHRRVWLGTFGGEAAAARAYDVAAQRFRGRDAVTNFKALDPADDADAAELCFLCAHSKAEIVDMLRKHTYADELRLSNSSFGAAAKPKAASAPHGAAAAVRQRKKPLFEKAVTPSDVGKLNRLVIPKQHAEKHLPLLTAGGTDRNGVLLSFEDDGGKIWRFRYSYWSSSQSYVLTKGWSRFVREKGLVAGDIVTFELSAGPERRIIIDHRRGPSPARVMRLFGVDIATYPTAAAAGCGGGIGKRRIDQMESFPTEQEQELFKRQHLEALQILLFSSN